MTNEQKLWLDAHPEYEIICSGGAGQTGQLGPMTFGIAQPNGAVLRKLHAKRGCLMPDGTFATGMTACDGAFMVGVRQAMAGHPGGKVGAT